MDFVDRHNQKLEWHLYVITLFIFLSSQIVPTAMADTVILKNGKRLSNCKVSQRGQIVNIDADGTHLRMPASAIARIEKDAPTPTPTPEPTATPTPSPTPSPTPEPEPSPASSEVINTQPILPDEPVQAPLVEGNGIEDYQQALSEFDWEAYRNDAAQLDVMLKAEQIGNDATVAQWMEKAAPQFRLIAEGNRKTTVAFPDFPNLDVAPTPDLLQASFNEHLVDLGRAQALGKLLCLKAMTLLEAGQTDLAMTVYEDSLAFASRLSATHSLVINKIAGLRVYEDTLESLGRTMDRGVAEPAVLERIAAMIARHPVDRYSSLVAMEGEEMVHRVQLAMVIDQMKNADPAMLAQVPAEQKKQVEELLKSLPQTWEETLALHNRLWQPILDAYRAPWSEFLEFDPEAFIADLPMILKQGVPNFVDFRVREEVLVARSRMLQLEALLRQHLAIHSTPPEQLDHLEMTIPMPLDPFTGEPFVYEQRTVSGMPGVQLTSPGPNMILEGNDEQWNEQNGKKGAGDVFHRFRLSR